MISVNLSDSPVSNEGADFVDEEGSLGSAGVLDTLLHHVGRELVLGEGQHLAAHSRHDLRLVLLKRKTGLSVRINTGGSKIAQWLAFFLPNQLPQVQFQIF